jgi:hypothetical protein
MHKMASSDVAPHKMSHPASETKLPPHLFREHREAAEGRMFRSWMRITRDMVLLGLETQRVIGLRLMKLSRGGRAAELEAIRMVAEKNTALAEAAMTLARGRSAGIVIRRYRTRVRSNKRRLSK